MQAGDCARQSLIASLLFLSVRIWQLEKLLPRLAKEATKSTDLSPLTLRWMRYDYGFHRLLYKI